MINILHDNTNSSPGRYTSMQCPFQNDAQNPLDFMKKR